jgi:MscS family membrane protein
MQLAMDILQDICNKNIDLDGSRTVTAFTEFGDFALTITFIYYINKGSDIFGTMNDVNMEILKQFNAEKLDFAFPTQTLFTNKES